jgi:dihydroxyacetone kinase phosphoprotein-dependent L subunit
MAKTSLTTEQTRDMMLQVADAIIEAEPTLTDADRALGDGDHGTGMKRGMTAVKEALDGQEFETVDKVLGGVGSTMMSSMGGASGAIFGTLFRTGGKAAKDAETLESSHLGPILTSGLEAIMKRGGAKPGQKTMIDALDPAATKAGEVGDLPIHEALAAIAEAAEAGKEASKAMVATMGRAKTLGEKSVGLPDAGAISVAVIFAAMRDYAAA